MRVAGIDARRRIPRHLQSLPRQLAPVPEMRFRRRVVRGLLGRRRGPLSRTRCVRWHEVMVGTRQRRAPLRAGSLTLAPLQQLNLTSPESWGITRGWLHVISGRGGETGVVQLVTGGKLS